MRNRTDGGEADTDTRAGELPAYLTWAKEHLEPHLAPYGGVDGVYWDTPRPAPSIAWRSEQQLLEAMLGAAAARGTMNRFVTRAWICEKRQHEGGSAQAGDSLGFVHIRPQELASSPRSDADAYRLALLEAYLEPPGYMDRPEYHVIRTRAARPYGEERLRCTPYFQPLTELDIPVACCGVANAFCAASLVTPMWGGICQGPFDLVVTAASRRVWGKTPEFNEVEGDSDDAEANPLEKILDLGISPACMVGMLRSDYVGLGAAYESLRADATALLSAYLSLGAPCIVWVDETRLIGAPYSRRREETEPVSSGEAHSILVIGYHSEGGNADRFVFHDTLWGPFREVMASVLVDAAICPMKLDNGEEADPACRFVAVLPPGVSAPISRVLEASHRIAEGFHASAGKLSGQTDDDCERACRLKETLAACPGRAVRLCSKHALPARYGDRDGGRDVAAVTVALNKCDVAQPRNWWWCVECSGSGRHEVLSHLMIARPRPEIVAVYPGSLAEARRLEGSPAVVIHRAGGGDGMEVWYRGRGKKRYCRADG